MRERDAFSTYHPFVNFLYFALVLLFSMCFMNPVCLAVSLLSALTYAICLKGEKAVRFAARCVLPILLVTILLNPLFNHEGRTLLAYLPSGNPLTLESILYGCGAATMLAAVVLWFFCYQEIMTSDKFVYLFGRVLPALSLVLSMALRFVPRFSAQLKRVARAQRCAGRTVSGGAVGRLRSGIVILSTLITWALENAIETADSMKSRGYGLPGRTAFSIYQFDGRDRLALLWLLFCGWYVTAGALAGQLWFRYYPTVKGTAATPFSLSFPLVYLALCLTPAILTVKEDRAWKRMQSKI
ncbi:MAG: energy-coupling factor transporter transmembrane component T [Oscillibacter sp.]|nr:energy-coupling factor transporter transmembrane component T [Oscillibacter sp.]MDD3347206.1 energy-coupling factor transporter transmembrane component T [Oscillibacter sp.]